MGHAHHFLSRLDRVSLQHVELSLGLYNNPTLLRFILARSGLPKGAPRVAISLDDLNEGPFLIVTREGRFVTCLGRGMSHEHPTVRRWQLDQLSERHHELKACMRPVADVPDDERAFYRLFAPVFEAGPNLSREQFRDLATWQPLMFKTYGAWIRETWNELSGLYHRLRRIERPRPCEHALLELYWKRLWAMRHLLVLLSVGNPVEYYEEHTREALEGVTESFGAFASYTSAAPVALAGAWCTARFGRAWLPVCGHAFERADRRYRVQQAALELSAVASTHAAFRDVTLRGLRAAGGRPANDGADDGLPELRADLAEKVARAFERDDDLDLRAAKHGAELLFAQRHPGVARHRWASPLDVPLDVARPVAAAHMAGLVDDDDTSDLLHALAPSVARYEPEDFFLPEKWLRDFGVAWTPEDTMKHVRQLNAYYRPRVPAKAAKQPGRNDACACGSGAKYKKCCALAAKKPEAPAEAERRPSLADGVMPRVRTGTTRASFFPQPLEAPRAASQPCDEAVDEALAAAAEADAAARDEAKRAA